MSTPSDREMRIAAQIVYPWRWMVSPVFYGIDNIPEKGPLLFVCNHSLGGFLDAPYMYVEVFQKKGIRLRPLGDHFHFDVPLWGSMLRRFGVVDGTRENCAELMRQGESILVFPGGAREVTKRRGEKYQLIWKDRLGFARLAIAHGCTIVPVAALGVEDAVDILYDGDDMMASPIVGSLLRRLHIRPDFLFPVVKGVGPTPFPRPERLYFRIGLPVDPKDFGTDPVDEAAVRDLRDIVRSDIIEGIHYLRERRAADPYRPVLRRLVSRVRRGRR